MKYLLFVLLLNVSFGIKAQNIDFELPLSVNANGNPNDPSAMLDVSSISKGILIPRLTTTQINDIPNPALGLLCYNTDSNVFAYYNGTIWSPLLATDAGVVGAGDIAITESNGVFTVLYNDPDKDNTNEVQFISKNANLISLSSIESIGGGTVTLDDDDPLNEIQDLIYNFSNNTLTISNNNNANVIDLNVLTQDLGTATFDNTTNELVINIDDGDSTTADLSDLNESVEGANDISVSEMNGVYTVDYTDGDKSNVNEAQVLSKSGVDISLTNVNGAGGGTITINDDSSTNEIQDLEFNNTTKVLKITDNTSATEIDLSDSFETVVGTNDISVVQNGGEFTVDYVDGDKSDTNESQTLSKNGADISLTMANGAGGGTITLNDDSPSNEIQDLSYNAFTNILNVTNNMSATDIDLTELEESVVGNNDITVTENAGVYTVDYEDGDKSNTNESQFLFRNFDVVTLTPTNNVGGGSFTLNDDSPSNEIQDLTYNASTNVLKITNNTSATDIDLTELEESVTGTNDITVTESNGVYTVDYIDADKSLTNEAQTLSKSGADISLTMANGAGGGMITLNDDSASNEIQDLTYNASTNVIKVTNNTSATDIDLTELEESVTGVNDITVTESNGVYTVDYLDSDKSNTNEAQTLSKMGSDISLTMANGAGGGTITLNDDSTTNEIQDLSYTPTTNILKVTNNTSATNIDLSGLQDDLGDHTATQDVVLDSNTLKLMASTDTKNGIRHAGATTMFNNYNPGGPALYGLNGGVLGTTNNQDSIILSWSENGRIGINTTNPSSELDVNGNITLSQSEGDEMIIKNDSDWTHSSGSQNMSFGSDGGDHFIMSSKEGSSEGSGIYGDADHMTIWASGEDIENPNAFLYIIDTDKMDNDNDPYDNSAVVAYLNSSGNWVSASDQNRKENIEQLDGSLEKILALNGYSYNFKRTEAEKERGMQAPHALGVIAQEVQQVIPEVVETKSNGEQFVSYSEFIPLLIESIKEQQAQIEALKTQVKILKEGK